MASEKTIAALAATEEERMLLVRVCDRIERAERREQPVSTFFLTPRERTLAAQLLPQAKFFGGTEGAERTVAYYLPEYLAPEDWLADGVVACLRATFYEKNVLTHRDMLGALMGAGLRRDAIGDIYVAGGVESMSGAPYLIPANTRTGNKMGNFTVVDHMIYDALTDARANIHMGVTAENIAKKYNITREQQDEFAYASQQKAIAAVDSGRFKDEIVPITVHLRKQDVVFDTDEHPNRKSNPEKLAKLRPAFIKEGTVTAGNASGINDGASFVLVASEDAVKKYNLTPLCEIVGIGQGGVDPLTMGLGPTPAIRNALNYADLKLDDMDLVELNEAFAAQSLGVLHELEEEHGIDLNKFMEKVNVNGGAIALGHPVGASGNRILVSLIHEMIKRDAKLGLASLCIGGGQGCAVIVKRP